MKTNYDKVEALRKKHPDLALTDLCKKAGVSSASYYQMKAKREGRPPPPSSLSKAKRKAQKAATKAPVKRRRPKADGVVTSLPAAPAGRMVLVMGSVDQLREMLAGVQ